MTSGAHRGSRSGPAIVHLGDPEAVPEVLDAAPVVPGETAERNTTVTEIAQCLSGIGSGVLFHAQLGP
ncbi:hypothetical protein ACFU8W_38385 [Streptomyces sp. NPDC057565]|uniref:hypothetical protein n=1 Tax=Streptomyces sp. NPDC057565 TaxID=3346169 RepID=UPI00368FCB07